MIRRGVTLIETLVVLALIALLASVAVLSAPAGRSTARDEAERFAVKVGVAQTLALTSGSPVQLDITPAGYGFRTYRRGKWNEITDRPGLRMRALRGDVAVAVTSLEAGLIEANDRGSDDGRRRLLIDSLGGGGAVSVAFSSPSARWVVTIDGSDAPKVSRNEE